MPYWLQSDPKSFLEAFKSFFLFYIEVSIVNITLTLNLTYKISKSKIIIRDCSLVFFSKSFLNFSMRALGSPNINLSFQYDALASAMVITFDENTS